MRAVVICAALYWVDNHRYRSIIRKLSLVGGYLGDICGYRMCNCIFHWRLYRVEHSSTVLIFILCIMCTFIIPKTNDELNSEYYGAPVGRADTIPATKPFSDLKSEQAVLGDVQDCSEDALVYGGN
jgi:hypothetical protein